jgi:hypothetical protein
MPDAQILRVWSEHGRAHMAVRVPGDRDGIDTEYIGSVRQADLQGLTQAEQTAALVAAVKAERERSKGTAAQDIDSITGTVTI